jgi:hypothetical protein
MVFMLSEKTIQTMVKMAYQTGLQAHFFSHNPIVQNG